MVWAADKLPDGTEFCTEAQLQIASVVHEWRRIYRWRSVREQGIPKVFSVLLLDRRQVDRADLDILRLGVDWWGLQYGINVVDLLPELFTLPGDGDRLSSGAD